MGIIVEPIREEEVLRPVNREATAAEVQAALAAKAGYCVDQPLWLFLGIPRVQ